MKRAGGGLQSQFGRGGKVGQKIDEPISMPQSLDTAAQLAQGDCSGPRGGYPGQPVSTPYQAVCFYTRTGTGVQKVQKGRGLQGDFGDNLWR